MACRQQQGRDSAGGMKRLQVVQTPCGLSAPDLRSTLVATDSAVQALAAAPLREGESCGVMYGRVVYSLEALEHMPLKELRDICRCRGLIISGKKQDLVERVLTSQLGPYPGGASGP
jgi:hypothetical protein